MTPSAPKGRRALAAPRVRLVLFDIDGTLVWTDGAGRRAIHRALIDVFGDTGPADLWFDGKTDPQIVRELMRVVGHADAHIDEHMQTLLDLYVAYLREELQDPTHCPRALPGVVELLHVLAEREDVVLGLLTGNLVDGARAKLEAVGIDPGLFRVGAYGSDHELRPELPAIARERAKETLGIEVSGENLVVVGDTPADIQCGQAIGARAIGVSTGRYPSHILTEHGAHSVFTDLSDTDAVVRAIVDDA
jgi:phosphoglycolate phosphatase-like HAD superfamily hydrolase